MVSRARCVLAAAHMCEIANLDRCAAYVAARAALIAVQRAVASWPTNLAARARHGAMDTVQLTAEAVSHDHATPGRRQCLREAITSALCVAATIDIAHAMGYGGGELLDVQRVAGRTVALLAMLLHASTTV